MRAWSRSEGSSSLTKSLRIRSDLRVTNALVLAGVDVAQVAQHAHDFVIAEQSMDRAAGAAGFVFEPFQQIERFPRIGPAIDDITELDEVGAPARPAQAFVQDSGGLQDLDEPIVRAVHVADRDDPIDAFDLA